MPNTWTKKDVTMLKDLWFQQATAAEISLAFLGKYSAESIYKKARRLELPKRRRGRQSGLIPAPVFDDAKLLSALRGKGG